MTRYRKLNPRTGSIPYRDTWHAHRREPRISYLITEAVGAGLFLFGAVVAFVYVWSL